MAYRTLHLHLFSYQSEKRRTAYRVARLVYSRSHAGKGVAMEVKLAVLADYANVSQDGKLNIMGIFQEINATALPFPLPQMYLVLTFEAGPAEFGSEKQLRVVLVDSDGNERMSLKGQVKVPRLP